MLTRRRFAKFSLASFGLFLPRYIRFDQLPQGLPEALKEADSLALLFKETFEGLRFDNIHTYHFRNTFINGNNVIQATAWSTTGRMSLESPYESNLEHVPRIIVEIYKYFDNLTTLG